MKTTINLEEKLTTSKRKELGKFAEDLKQSQLILEQTNAILQHDGEKQLSILKSAGFHRAIANAEALSVQHKEKTETFASYHSSERVFNKAQIKKLAIVYGLRFLPTSYYKGDLPYDLGNDIQKALEATGKMVTDKNSYFILAPKESFELSPKPVDPLLFLNLGNNMFYLVRKWGTDLSTMRYWTNLLKRNYYPFLTLVFLISCCAGSFVYSHSHNDGSTAQIIFEVLFAIFCGVIAGIVATLIMAKIGEALDFDLNCDSWDSEQKFR